MNTLWQAIFDELVCMEAELIEVSETRATFRMSFDDHADPSVVTVSASATACEEFAAWAGEDDVSALASSALSGREEGEDFLVVHRGSLRWSIREELPPVSMRRARKRWIAESRRGA